MKQVITGVKCLACLALSKLCSFNTVFTLSFLDFLSGSKSVGFVHALKFLGIVARASTPCVPA